MLKRFKFQNGQEKDKLAVVVGKKASEDKYLCCLVTSKQDRGRRVRSDQEDPCDIKSDSFFIKENTEFFNKNTWILFDKIYPFSKNDLEENLLRGAGQLKTTEYKDDLKQQTYNALINCINGSNNVEEIYKDILKKNKTQFNKPNK